MCCKENLRGYTRPHTNTWQSKDRFTIAAAAGLFPFNASSIWVSDHRPRFFSTICFVHRPCISAVNLCPASSVRYSPFLSFFVALGIGHYLALLLLQSPQARLQAYIPSPSHPTSAGTQPIDQQGRVQAEVGCGRRQGIHLLPTTRSFTSRYSGYCWVLQAVKLWGRSNWDSSSVSVESERPYTLEVVASRRVQVRVVVDKCICLGLFNDNISYVPRSLS